MNFKDRMYIFFICYKEIIIMHAIRLTFRNTKTLKEEPWPSRSELSNMLL